MIVLAGLGGYLIGSIPTADALGRLRGVRLTEQGSGNPGTNNALRVFGISLAAPVLIVEFTKGAGAVIVGSMFAGEVGAVAAGLGAIIGNVFNVWYQFRGGKGLAITGGVLLALWPTVLIPAIAVLAVAVIITRSSGAASLITMGGLVAMSIVWRSFEWSTGWGVEDSESLIVASVVIALVLLPKHWTDFQIKRQSRLRHPAQG